MDRITRGESPSPRPIKKRTTKTSEQLVMGFAPVLKSTPISLPPNTPHRICLLFFFAVTMNIMSPRFVLLVYLLGHDLIVEPYLVAHTGTISSVCIFKLNFYF